MLCMHWRAGVVTPTSHCGLSTRELHAGLTPAHSAAPRLHATSWVRARTSVLPSAGAVAASLAESVMACGCSWTSADTLAPYLRGLTVSCLPTRLVWKSSQDPLPSPVSCPFSSHKTGLALHEPGALRPDRPAGCSGR